MAKQVQVLKGPTIGPEGDRVEGGVRPPDTWPKWFLDDLREAGCLVLGYDDESSTKRRPDATVVSTTGASKRARRTP